MTKFIKTKGIVLRRTNFGEADRIIQFLTPEGQISVMAKGVRKPKSKLAGALELFSITQLVLIKTKTDFYRLTSARLDQYFDNIIKDYSRMEMAYFVLSQISKNSHDVDDQSWFEILHQVLAGLDAGYDVDLVKCWFLIQSAEIIGEPYNFVFDQNGQKILPDKNYNFDQTSQTFYQIDSGKFSKNHFKIMRLMTNQELYFLTKIKNLDDYIVQINELFKTFS